MSEPDHNLSRDELERERADVLPDREAMSPGGGTDAAGSSSGTGSSTSEDRSETISASDSATAGG
jgi:hypothetical protein